MRRCILFATAVLCLLCVSGQAGASFIYSLDDGSAESSVGLSLPGGSVFLANGFDTVPGAEVITSIQVRYGGSLATVGTPVVVSIFKDQNGGATPDKPVLLSSVASSILAKNSFNSYDIPPTPVSGNFFVGVLVSNLPASGLFPILSDTTTPQNRSFGAFYSTPVGIDVLSSMTFDPTKTTGDFQTTIDKNVIARAPGDNFMIRAVGVSAVPEPASVVMAATPVLIGLGCWWRRRKRAAA